LDAAANTCGQRVVFNLDGTAKTVNYATAAAASDAQFTQTRTAGGKVERADIKRYVPQSVVVTFRKVIGGNLANDPYTVSKTLSSLTLTEYGASTGVASSSALIHADYTYTGSNTTNCESYATQAAKDWYYWQLADTEVTYPGLVAWAPTGLEDAIEWHYKYDQDGELVGLTRVLRGPWFEFPSGDYKKGDVSTSTPPAVACTGCGFFAGATEYDCWTVTVVNAQGNMSEVDTSQSLSLLWGGTTWVSSSDFTVCDYAGTVILDRDTEGEPRLYLSDPGYYLTLSCCDPATQTMYFTGGNSGNTVLCCAKETDAGPASNQFTLAVKWTKCPNPDWGGPGYYCVAVSTCEGSKSCCNLTEDPGLGAILCSGPYADLNDCQIFCGETEIVEGFCVCPETVQVPTTLYATITGATAPETACLIGTTVPITYRAGHGGHWGGCAETACGINIYVLIICDSGECDESGTGFGISIGCMPDPSDCPSGDFPGGISATGSTASFDPFLITQSGITFEGLSYGIPFSQCPPLVTFPAFSNGSVSVIISE
jgi:hypothetical protein